MSKLHRICLFTFLILLCFILFKPISTEAQTTGKDITALQENVAKDKVWRISFSQPLDKQFLISNHFQVLDYCLNPVDIKIGIDDSGKVVRISPCQPYTPGSTYRLVAKAGIKSLNGSTLGREINMPFTIQPDEIGSEGLPRLASREQLLSLLDQSQSINNSVRYWSAGSAMPVPTTIGGGGTTSADAAVTDQQSGSSDYSSTNVQVEGVDEGDIVKTDGEYVYQIRSQEVVIGKIFPAEQMKFISRFSFADANFNPQELYINNDLLVIIGSSYSYIDESNSESSDDKEQILAGSRYPIITTRSTTKVIIYDVSDCTTPALVHEAEVEGSYLSSRIINNSFYFVSNKIFPYYYDIQTLGDEQLLPSYRDSLVSEKEFISLDFQDIRYFPDSPEANYLMVASLNLLTPQEPVKVSAYLGSGQEIYVSQEHLYAAAPHYNYTSREDDPPQQNNGDTSSVAPAIMPTIWDFVSTPDTTIYKFALQDGLVSYESRGLVQGTVLNQFSMDEYQGNFRIATTKGDAWTSMDSSSNNVYVLNENMDSIGKLENLAPGEKIYSVRFMGERAYMVTFKTVDPLFVLSLSDPAQPAVLGQLKIPGYSDYLHPYDATHLLGFGKDTVEIDGRAYYLGMKVAMFDVSDVANPREMGKVTIGDRGTDSELLRNHKALLFNKSKGLLAFPVTVKEVAQNSDNTQGDSSSSIPAYGSLSFQGAYVYNVDLNNAENVLQYRDRISHMDEGDYPEPGYYADNTRKYIERVLYVGDTLYTFSKTQWQANSLTNLEQQTSLLLP